MTDSVLDLLKLLFLGLLYVFFARVLWAVWSEVRQSNQRVAAPAPQSSNQPSNQSAARVTAGSPPDPTPIGSRQPVVKAGTPAKTSATPGRGRKGNPTRLVVIEPRERKGVTYHIDSRLTFGRESDNSVVLLDDAYLSGHHAIVAADETGAVSVTDLVSRNGTLHNGSRIEGTRRVTIGDRIQIGYTVLEAQ